MFNFLDPEDLLFSRHPSPIGINVGGDFFYVRDPRETLTGKFESISTFLVGWILCILGLNLMK